MKAFIFLLFAFTNALVINKRGTDGKLRPPEKGNCSEMFLVGKILNNQYLIEKNIGVGGEGYIYSATFKDKNFAVKCLINSNLPTNEIEMHKKLSHPNILKFVDSFEAFGHYFLVTELCETDLLELMLEEKPLNVKKLFTELLDAVIYLHSMNISHRDIKPENIFITSTKNPVVKLADFGYATTETLTKKVFLGTKMYSSPEICARKQGIPWVKNDIWSMAVLLFGVTTGSVLWEKPVLDYKVTTTYIDSCQNDYGLSSYFGDLLRISFSSPRFRPTAVQFKQMFLNLDSMWADGRGPKTIASKLKRE